MLAPGSARSEAEWTSALSQAGVTLGKGPLGLELEFVENDGGFGDAFSFGTVPAKQVKQIDAAPSALVIYGQPSLRENRKAYLELAFALKAAGAMALRLEESKLGWLIDEWIERVSGEDPASMLFACVVTLEGAAGKQSCGMHLFGMPDVRCDDEAVLNALNRYQLDEDPLLISGHTFAPDAKTRKRELIRWPDDGYPQGHPCHNPFGVWRLGKPGAKKTLSVSDKAMVFMPSLAALLTAAEEKKGRALTQKEVLAVRDNGVCMAMEWEDAQNLERSRGYADLEPELVWEQWKVLRHAGAT